MKHDQWENRNLADDPAQLAGIRRHFRYLTDRLMRISKKQPGVTIARQDDRYPAGGDLTWDEVVPETAKAEARRHS